MLALVAGVGMFFQVPFPQPAPPPAQVTVHNDVTVSAPPPDPQVVAETSATAAQAVFVSVVTPPFVKFANDLMNIPDVVKSTPPRMTYEAAPLNQLGSNMVDWSIPLTVIAIIVLAVARQVGEYTGLGGRVLFAVVMCMGSLLWWRLGIQLNNLICAAIAPPDLTTWGRPTVTEWNPMGNPADQVATAALTIVHAIVLIMLIASMWFRIAFIDIFMVVCALPQILKATPESEHFGTKYDGLAVGLLFSQILVVIGLKVADVLHAEAGAAASGGTLLVILVLLATRKMPGMLSQIGSGGKSVVQRAGESLVRRKVFGH